MDALLRLLRRLRILIRRQRFSSELEEEMGFHREQLEKEFREDGVDPEEARYAARRRFGSELQLREQSHDVVAFRLETVLQDLRYAARQLRRNPGFAATAVLILALGIGATTAIFSVVNPILFQPLPYPHPGRVAMIWETHGDGVPLAVSFGTFFGLRERSRSFDAIAVEKPWQPTMTSAAEPERFNGQRVTPAYFRALGIVPVLGRDFQPSDDQFKGPNVVMLSDRLWRRRFGSDAAVLGRGVTLDGNLYTVIGVMPRSFENVLDPSAELWAPLQYNPSLPPDGREWGHHLRMIGRLLPGVRLQQAANEGGAILHIWAQTHAAGYRSSGGAPSGLLVHSLQDDITRDVRPALLAILGAVALVLLIACVNVTSLLLARGGQRRGEFAMRAALGASRSRLARQWVTESLLLAVVGGVCGMVVAELGVRALVALSPPGLPRLDAIRIDGAIFTFGMAMTTLIGLGCGLVPALHISRGNLHLGIGQSSLRTVRGHHTTRRTLVVAEVALALVLLVSAGLLLRSVQRIFAVALGFDPSHLLTMQVQEAGTHFQTDADRERIFEQALEAVKHVPGVTSAAFTSQLPLSGDFESYGMQFEAWPNDQFEPAFRYAVTPDYFATMRIPLLRGRLLDERDRAGAPVVVLISESLARRKFPGKDPIGQRVRIGPDIGHADRPWDVIVGVVGDVKQVSLAVTEPDAFYTTSTQWAWVDNVQSLVVRTPTDAASLAPAVRTAIWSVDKDQPIARVATMENLIAASESQRHFALVLFEAFALVALLLAATGIYGVLSGSVTERTREIGVRSALGASRNDILALVFRQGMMLAALGVVLGLLGAFAASRALITLLFGVSPLDPLTYAGVVALLLGVAAFACLRPARRAARIDPAMTLRAE
ncbi:MAG TPA: ABC transporter permease [Candidatus Binatia bacterium]|nr:ABC transporter permease [Candidatus Binatia bacterium]